MCKKADAESKSMEEEKRCHHKYSEMTDKMNG
jgi:hypothetical protein